MTFTYDSTSIATDLAKVRLKCGDTLNRGDKSLTDEEIAYVLTEHTNLEAAALECMYLRLARLTKYIDRNQSGIDEQQTQEIQSLKDMIQAQARKLGKRAKIYCYSGQIDKSQNETHREDSTYEQPRFRVGGDNYATNDDEDYNVG